MNLLLGGCLLRLETTPLQTVIEVQREEFQRTGNRCCETRISSSLSLL